MTKSLHSERYGELLVILSASRKKAGLTQAQMASRLDKPQSYVSKLERGERRTDVIEFIEFIEAADADPIETLRALRRVIQKTEAGD